MKYLIALIAFITISLALFCESIPEFKLPDMNNQDVKLSSLLGKGPVIIDFWATWCEPCKKGMAALSKLTEKYDSLTVVVVSIDAPKDVSKAKNYLKSKNYRFIGLFDKDKTLAKQLNVVNPPQTYILDKMGNIILSHNGYEAGNESEYESVIQKLLNLTDQQPMPNIDLKESSQ